MFGGKGKTELYDLETDLFEKNNVASQNPEILEQMKKILAKESSKSEHYPAAGGEVY